MELLLDGLMKDYESKRELAVLFTTNYPSLVSDFIQDDQVDYLSTFIYLSVSTYFTTAYPIIGRILTIRMGIGC